MGMGLRKEIELVIKQLEMKKKQVVTGWMNRTTKRPINTDMSIDNTIDTNVYRGKGRKILFHPDDWPPIKVTLTAEWDETEEGDNAKD